MRSGRPRFKKTIATNSSRSFRKYRPPSIEMLETRCLLAGDLVAKWVADDLAAVDGGETPVAEWLDSVDSIRAASIGSPTLIPEALGGRSMVRFAPADGDDGFRVRSINNPLAQTGDFSVVVAFRTDSQALEGGQAEWFKNTGLVDSDALGLTRDWGISINESGQISAGMGIAFGAAPKTLYGEASGLNDGQLHIVTFTRSGTQLSLYVDDQPAVARNDADPGLTATLDVTFGILQTGQLPFTGEIGQVHFYHGALSETEVATIVQDVTAYYSNQPPVSVDDAYSLSEDTPLLVTASNGVLRNDTDPDGDPLTAQIVTPPAHGQLALQPDGSVVYAPEKDFFGLDSFTYAAKDFRLGNIATVTLNVLPAYDRPTAVADRYELLPGQATEVPIAQGVLANDLNPDQGVLRAVLQQGAAQGSVTLREDGSFRYDPEGFFGTTSFTYVINDGTSISGPATVTLVVNSAPVAADDQYVMNEDQVLEVDAAGGLLANDADAEGDPLELTLISLPEHGQLEVQPDGSFRYVPVLNYFGDDQFTYNLSDGLLSSGTATVRIEVVAVNDPPVAVADTYVTEPNTTLQIAAEDGLLSNDIDVDDPELSVQLVSPPNRGTLQLNQDGSFIYQPANGALGRDQFSYRASDARAQSAPVVVNLIVNEGTVQETDPTGDSIVTFNEIMYNPAGSTDEQLEWVELHNQMAIDMDLTGWRLSGGMSFAFPAGTVIPGGGYLVIAADPVALQEAIGFAGALGPFEGRLDNGGEEIELRNNSDRVMDLLDYNDRGNWPVGPDGSGATLAKRSVHLATAEASSWATSRQMNGTPGAENFPADQPMEHAAIQLNEISAGWSDPFFVELANLSDQPVDLQGYTLYSSANDNRRYEFPSRVVAPGAYFSIELGPLGIRAGNEDRIFLLAPGGNQVVDAQEVTLQLRGRSPRHEQRWLIPSEPTFGRTNQFVIDDNIVINELMYHAPGFYAPQSDRLYDNPEEWVELYNRSPTKTVDLSGWSFAEAIDFVFPAGTQLGPDSYLVVANDPEGLLSTRPELRSEQVLGPFSRRLANGGERIELLDQHGNPVDWLRYYDEGRWPSEADGRAASLELRDPFSDNAVAEAWAASNELSRSSWQTITYSGSGRNNGNDPAQYHELILGLLDDGEVLIDDIRVIENPGTAEARQILQNGDFENDLPGAEAAAWRIIGTHQGSVIVDPDDPNNQVLRLVASGPTEHMHNHAETTFKIGDDYIRLNNRNDYEISFRARWVSGSNQLNSRLYFNRLPRVTRLSQPLSVGTPGQVNSRYESNIGPTYRGLIHSPAVPDPEQPVQVSIQASDAQGIAQLTVWYSVNGAEFVGLPMTLNQEGTYVATIPGQAGSSLVQFYVEGQDGQGAASMYPAAGPESRALYRVQDGQANSDVRHTVRILMTPEDTDRLHELTNVMSNARIGATVIYREQEIFYDVGVRLKGSQRGRFQNVRVGFNIGFDPEHLFRGVHETIGVDRSGTGDEYSQEEIIVRQIINHAGDLPQIYDDLIHVIAPQSRHTGSAMLNMARYNDVFLDSQYENGSQGTVFEYELIYYPTTTTGGPEGLKRPTPDSVVGVPMQNQGDDKELYRWHWLIKNNRKEDDYSQLMVMLKALGLNQNSPDFHPQTQQLLDVDQWLRSFAVQTLAGIGDNYISGAQHNGVFYVRPTDGKTLFLPWDMDFSFTQGATSSLVLNSDLRKLLSDPGSEHAYYGHVYDILQTTFNRDYMDPWIDHFDELVPGQSFFQGFKSYIGQRYTSAMGTETTRGQIERAVPKVDFEITTAGPLDVGDSTTARLEGTGWVDVREVRLRGENVPLPITWSTNNQWLVDVPVGRGTQEVTLEAYDYQGQLVTSDVITVTSSAAAPVRDYLRISELHYNPSGPVEGELELDNDEFEFVELINTGPESLDLTGVRFVYVQPNSEEEGIDFVFSAQTLAPGGRLVVPGNRDAFLSRYGSEVPLANGQGSQDPPGSFTGRLDNGGETITLLDATNAIVQQFAYDDGWYPSTDGGGFSLEFVDPHQADLDAWNQGENWQASGIRGGTPGTGPRIIGDSNLDGIFNEADLVLVLQAGEYEDGIPDNSTWEEGDWNGDGDFDTGDLVLALQAGTYSPEVIRAAQPSSIFDDSIADYAAATAPVSATGIPVSPVAERTTPRSSASPALPEDLLPAEAVDSLFDDAQMSLISLPSGWESDENLGDGML